MLASETQQFLSFHNRVEFGTILVGLRNFGGGGILNTTPPPPVGTPVIEMPVGYNALKLR